MKPTEVLKHEHRVIEQVLDCLERIAARCRSDGRLERGSAREVLDFFRSYADTCHHGKEEQHLFPMLEARGFSGSSGPVAVMRYEHEQGRELIQGMDRAIDGAGAGDSAACAEFVHNARAYAALLRAHIQKEDNCLFPMADQALSDADQVALADCFEQVERDELEPGIHDKYVRLANELTRRNNVAGKATGIV